MTAPLLVQRFLPENLASILNRHLAYIRAKRPANKLLSDYHRGRELVERMNIAIPAEWNVLKTVIGWAGMAVDVPNERMKLRKLFVTGSSEQDQLLQDIIDNNGFLESFRMGQMNSLIHGVCFGVATVRDDGQTPVTLFESATKMTGDYDRRAREMTSAASEDDPLPVTYARPAQAAQATLYTTEGNYVVEKWGNGKWLILGFYENLSKVFPVVRLVNRAHFDRPWGSTEMTRAVRSATDAAVRTLLGWEVNREFFAAPSRFALGVDESQFTDANGRPIPGFMSYIGKMLALPAIWEGSEDDNEGETYKGLPQVGQFPASSPEPFISSIKMLSQLVSAETGIPASNLGFVSDNPPGADAINALDGRMISRAEDRMEAWGHDAVKLGKLQLIAAGIPVADIQKISPDWRSAATPTVAATTDAVNKNIASGVLEAESELTMELLNFAPSVIERRMDEIRRKRTQAMLGALAGAAGTVNAPLDPAAVKLQTDAMGSLIRAGATPESAAAAVGLTGLKFIPGLTPVTLKSNEPAAPAVPASADA